MTRKTAVIVDDEHMARTLLQGMIEKFCPEVQVVGLSENLSTGVKAIRKLKPDLVFLDIEMPGHSGLELLDFFDESEIDFSIIFVTAYDRYAIQAFKLSAVDYLLKPIESEDLIRAVELSSKVQKQIAVLKQNLTQTNKKIGINTVHSTIFVPLESILFFQANGSYTTVYIKNEKSILASKGLKYFETLLLDQSAFIRCHKSYIVNTNHITEYVRTDGGHLKVYDHEVGISPDKVVEILKKITNH